MPTYCATNDPLLTYATPLHAQEDHTTTRRELIGQYVPETSAVQSNENSNSSTESIIKSWSLDHSYVPLVDLTKPQKKGKFVKSKKIDYKNLMWPRDALYICYKESKFEFILEAEANGETPYYCDCCDPSRQNKKRSYSTSDEEDIEEVDMENDNDENDLDDEDEDEESNSGDSTRTDNNKTENNTPKPKLAQQPGWFGKGRRKKARC